MRIHVMLLGLILLAPLQAQEWRVEYNVDALLSNDGVDVLIPIDGGTILPSYWALANAVNMEWKLSWFMPSAIVLGTVQAFISGAVDSYFKDEYPAGLAHSTAWLGGGMLYRPAIFPFLEARFALDAGPGLYNDVVYTGPLTSYSFTAFTFGFRPYGSLQWRMSDDFSFGMGIYPTFIHVKMKSGPEAWITGISSAIEFCYRVAGLKMEKTNASQ